MDADNRSTEAHIEMEAYLRDRIKVLEARVKWLEGQVEGLVSELAFEQSVANSSNILEREGLTQH